MATCVSLNCPYMSICKHYNFLVDRGEECEHLKKFVPDPSVGYISQDFLDGMKCVGKALAKECKRQQTRIKELKNKARYSWDWEDIHEEEDRLSHCVEMKVLAEKLYKKYNHTKEESEK